MLSVNITLKALKGKLKKTNYQIKNLSLYLLATIVSSLIGVIMNPFLAANLSPQDYAVLGYFTSFNNLILFIISFSFLSYYSRNYYRIEKEERQTVLNTLLTSQFLLGLIALIFVLLVFYLYMYAAGVSFPFFPFALLCFIPIFFSSFYSFLLIEKRMKREALSYFIITLAFALSGAFFAIIFVVILKGGAIGRFWSILIPTVGLGIYSFKNLLSRFELSKNILLDAIKFGWPISLSSILFYFLSSVDRAMLEPLNDATTFGIYNVAIQIVTYLTVFYTAIVQTFEPDIYKSIAENNRKKLFKLFIGILILNAIPNLMFIIFANPIVNILTYGRYTESTVFARILAVKNIPMAACFLISNVIIGYGYPKVELINRSVGALISVILYKMLIDRYGFFGAAWGQTLAYIFMTLISLSFIYYKTSIQKLSRA